MSTDILVEHGYSKETYFYVLPREFDLLCEVIKKSAKEFENKEVYELCQDAQKDQRLLLLYSSAEARRFFGEELQKALNNGIIISEILSWPTPEFDNSRLLPECQKSEVVSFICNCALINTLSRLSQYLLKNKSFEDPPTSQP